MVHNENNNQYHVYEHLQDELMEQATDRDDSEGEKEQEENPPISLLSGNDATRENGNYSMNNNGNESNLMSEDVNDDDDDDDNSKEEDDNDENEEDDDLRTKFDFDQRYICGIYNIGNTCYLNSAVQALCGCSHLFHMFHKESSSVVSTITKHMIEYKEQQKIKALRSAKLCLLFKTVNQYLVMKNIDQTSSAVLSIKEFVHTLWSIFPANFRPYYQEDSQEFIQFLLDTLHEETKIEVNLLSENGEMDNSYNSNNNNNNNPYIDPKELQILYYIWKQHKKEEQKEKMKRLEQKSKKPFKLYVSPISDIFGGYLLNEVTCHNCQTVSTTMQSILGGLSIEIPDKRITQRYTIESSSNGSTSEDKHGRKRSLSTREMDLEHQISFISSLLRINICECLNPLNLTNLFRSHDPWLGNGSCMHLFDCLDSFFQATLLNEDNLYECEKCNSKQESTQKLSLIKLPKVLCLHIKRFYTAQSSFFMNIFSSGMGCFKRTEKIQFPDVIPVKELRKRYMKDFVTKYCPEDTMDNGVYKLCSVINHQGYGISSGHYTSFVRVGDRWYKCDDSDVSQVSKKTVHDSEAYVLFYELQN